MKPIAVKLGGAIIVLLAIYGLLNLVLILSDIYVDNKMEEVEARAKNQSDVRNELLLFRETRVSAADVPDKYLSKDVKRNVEDGKYVAYRYSFLDSWFHVIFYAGTKDILVVLPTGA